MQQSHSDAGNIWKSVRKTKPTSLRRINQECADRSTIKLLVNELDARLKLHWNRKRPICLCPWIRQIRGSKFVSYTWSAASRGLTDKFAFVNGIPRSFSLLFGWERLAFVSLCLSVLGLMGLSEILEEAEFGQIYSRWRCSYQYCICWPTMEEPMRCKFHFPDPGMCRKAWFCDGPTIVCVAVIMQFIIDLHITAFSAGPMHRRKLENRKDKLCWTKRWKWTVFPW